MADFMWINDASYMPKCQAMLCWILNIFLIYFSTICSKKNRLKHCDSQGLRKKYTVWLR